MTNIPKNPILRGIEDIVKSHGQLDHPEARAQVATGLRDIKDDIGAKLVRELLQFL